MTNRLIGLGLGSGLGLGLANDCCFMYAGYICRGYEQRATGITCKGNREKGKGQGLMYVIFQMDNTDGGEN